VIKGIPDLETLNSLSKSQILTICQCFCPAATWARRTGS